MLDRFGRAVLAPRPTARWEVESEENGVTVSSRRNDNDPGKTYWRAKTKDGNLALYQPARR